jgi:glycosyltransferase involved in cell wall biosynthesis
MPWFQTLKLLPDMSVACISAADRSMRILVLTKYGRLGASSRLRFMQYFPCLETAGVEVVVQSLISDALLLHKYGSGSYALLPLTRAYLARLATVLQARKFDLLWVEKEAFQWFPLWLERLLLRRTPYVLDYDDAVFHHYDQHRIRAIRLFFGSRLDGLMSSAELVVGGNRYLAQRAESAGCANVVVVPTVIDLARYPVRRRVDGRSAAADLTPRIVWIGSPSTVRYLKLIQDSLVNLKKKYSFVLRVIGGGKLDVPGISVESVEWSEDAEFSDVSECDIGIMPLLDSDWERGKCGYKLIQYMACGLPVVASNIGVNSEIVRQGENGFLVDTGPDWELALGKLLADAGLRALMGAAGRHRVEQQYCVQRTGPRMVDLLKSAASR